MKFKWDDVTIIKYIEDNGYVFIKFIENGKRGLSRRILVKCDEHEPYEVIFNNFKRGRRCRKCTTTWTSSYEEVKEFVENNGYKLHTKKEDYKNNLSDILLECNKGHMYTTQFTHFKRGKRCRFCGYIKVGENNRLNVNKIINLIEEIGYKLLTPIEDYKNEKTKLKLQCDKGHIYTTQWCVLRDGGRCTICRESKGERRIRKYLEENSIYFISQKHFKDLRGDCGAPLRFDFYLPQHNTLIEYQGEFHDGNNTLQTKDELFKQQKYDNMKREYVKYNDIKLIEIWYYDYDKVEDLLNEYLKF